VEFVGDEPLTQAFQAVVYSSEESQLDVKPGALRPATLTLTGQGPGGLTVRKQITFHPDSFIVDYEVQVINYGNAPRPVHVLNDFGLGPNTNHARVTRGHYGPMYRAGGKIHKADTDDIKQTLRVAEPQWLAMSDTYFITAVAPQTPVESGVYTLLAGAMEGKYPVAGYGMELPAVNLEPQKMIGSKFKLYLGPKSTNEMLKFGNRLEESLDLTLDFIASPMLAMLRWFFSFTHNYGAAIVMLTIVVRVLLFPLTYKGMVSMKRMQKLQPKMVALRERMKGDKEKLNREMMEMYRRHKVNPLSGCLPIVFQIPIFFALYSALLGAIELRHSPFALWIADLSAMDGLYVLPLLMGGSMFFQQRLTPTSLDPMQAKIMLWMPVIFTFFMLNFPAGLTLYWFTSNLLSIAQQLIINRVKIPDFAD
jgi:YidC/Oxa1 family membrane protein insertase